LIQQELVQSLQKVAAALPDLVEDIQGQLLDLMVLILSGERMCVCVGGGYLL
jgi:hypothetical protein